LSRDNVDDRIKRKVEKWDDIVNQLSLDISKPVNYVTARQIKQISREEPRLMAKIDTIQELPTIFKRNICFFYQLVEDIMLL
jgi:hypothetical protein